jgi:hypothetical protein
VAGREIDSYSLIVSTAITYRFCNLPTIHHITAASISSETIPIDETAQETSQKQVVLS